MTDPGNSSAKGRIEATYKALDVEEVIDIYFYRPIGYAIAVGSKKLGLSPNTLSVVGMLFGVLGGHFFFYDDLALNIVGIVCWMLGQAFDGADGQLARMANMRSRLGRVLDGLSDSFKFLSVYIHICLRLGLATGAWWVYAIGFLAALSHSAQSAFADYYRNLYLFFVIDPRKGEIDHSEVVANEYREMRWGTSFMEKLLWWLYVPYTRMQERMSGSLDALKEAAASRFGHNIPEAVSAEYKRRNKPHLPYYNALTTNTRMLVLYAALLFGSLWWYLLFDLIVLNAVLVVMRMRQDRTNRAMMAIVNSAPTNERERAQAPATATHDVG
jgi:hypothetical protein